MVLKPQDIVVALKLVALAQRRWTYVHLANELYMSVSEINAGVKRATQAQLIAAPPEANVSPRPVRKALEEFLIHGVRYAYPPDYGALTRGVPTAHAAPPLAEALVPSNEPPPVWPDPEGEIRGYAFSPLYRSVPKAARVDRDLYELLSLVDAIRGGRARERELASQMLRDRLARYKEQYRDSAA